MHAAPVAEDLATDDEPSFQELLVIVGRRARELRELQGMTLAVLAEFTGLAQPALSRIERGKYNVTLLTAFRLAKGLGVPLHELFVPRDQSAIRPVRRGKES